MTITLKNIKTRARQSGSTSGSGTTSGSGSTSGSGTTGGGFDYTPSNLGDYFILILEILAGFIVFCWIATSNYLNATTIDINATYPIGDKDKDKDKDKIGVVVEILPKIDADPLKNPGKFRKLENLGLPKQSEVTQTVYGDNNPYATWFAPDSINMKSSDEIDKNVNLRWWLERTQQSSYELGGFILNKVFKGLQEFTVKIDENEKSTSTMATRIFTSILRILFDIFSVCMFTIFLGLVFCMWIPGWLGGLTAFMPFTYYNPGGIWKLCKQGFILFATFVWMCLFGWVTIFPVIWQFFYLIYLMFVKQLRDNAGQFGTEFLKRMQSLVYIYVVTALIIAFASTELPNPTKFTVGVVSAIAIGIHGIHVYMNQRRNE